MQGTASPQAARSFENLFAVALGAPVEPEVKAIALETLEEDDEPAREKNLGEHYRDLWQQYCRTVDANAVATNALNEAESRVVTWTFGRDRWRVFEQMSEDAVKSIKEKRAKEIRERLMFAACEVFAPPGTKLSIDQYEVAEKFPLDDLDAFDPIAIWTYLENTYGGEAGERLAWCQVATAFKRNFSLDRQQEVVVKGGYVVLDDHVYIDDFDKKYGKIRLSYSSRESVLHACNAIADVARWADRTLLLHDIRRFAQQQGGYDVVLESRKQYPMGENGELVVVTYQSRYEYRFRKDFAEQLQVFLGTYCD